MQTRLLRLPAVVAICAGTAVWYPGGTAGAASHSPAVCPTDQGLTITCGAGYGTDDGLTLTLDAYQPTASLGTALPAVVLIHGGEWDSGSNEGDPVPIAEQMASDGLVTFSINYTEDSPGHPSYPQAVDDAQAAVNFLHSDPSQAGEWDINPADCANYRFAVLPGNQHAESDSNMALSATISFLQQQPGANPPKLGCSTSPPWTGAATAFDPAEGSSSGEAVAFGGCCNTNGCKTPRPARPPCSTRRSPSTRPAGTPWAGGRGRGQRTPRRAADRADPVLDLVGRRCTSTGPATTNPSTGALEWANDGPSRDQCMGVSTLLIT